MLIIFVTKYHNVETFFPSLKKTLAKVREQMKKSVQVITEQTREKLIKIHSQSQKKYPKKIPKKNTQKKYPKKIPKKIPKKNTKTIKKQVRRIINNLADWNKIVRGYSHQQIINTLDDLKKNVSEGAKNEKQITEIKISILEDILANMNKSTARTEETGSGSVTDGIMKVIKNQ
jgi:hypothetical protein